MIIKILGTGCPNCKRLETNTVEAVNKLGINADIQKITDIAEIMSYDIISTPCLVVDEKVVLQGKVACVDEIKIILSNIK